MRCWVQVLLCSHSGVQPCTCSECSQAGRSSLRGVHVVCPKPGSVPRHHLLAPPPGPPPPPPPPCPPARPPPPAGEAAAHPLPQLAADADAARQPGRQLPHGHDRQRRPRDPAPGGVHLHLPLRAARGHDLQPGALRALRGALCSLAALRWAALRTPTCTGLPCHKAQSCAGLAGPPQCGRCTISRTRLWSAQWFFLARAQAVPGAAAAVGPQCWMHGPEC